MFVREDGRTNMEIVEPKIAVVKSMVRKMRGACQAHLIETEGSGRFVVKFANNPHGARVLINEGLAACLLRYVGVSSPDWAVVSLDLDTINRESNLFVQRSAVERSQPSTGLHFGSRYVGDLTSAPVYDFLPAKVLGSVSNLSETAAMLTFDLWVETVEPRQCVFARKTDRNNKTLPEFRAYWIDNSHVLGGTVGTLGGSRCTAPCRFHMLHDRKDVWKEFEPWIEKIREVPANVLHEALKHIPLEWVDDYPALMELLDRLWSRRTQVARLLEEAIRT